MYIHVPAIEKLSWYSDGSPWRANNKKSPEGLQQAACSEMRECMVKSVEMSDKD